MIHTHEDIRIADTSESRKPRPNEKSFKVFFCPKCRRCFDEFQPKGEKKGYNSKNIYYCDSFPSYGLVRKLCRNCKGE